MAVVLVLASGTAVSLAVTDSTTDVETNAVAAQETTTAADDEGETASVTINEQETEGDQVVIESATLPEGGFIAIHDSSVAEAPLSSVLGNSVYLEPGTHENVTITLARPIEESQTLIAMPHLDTNDNEVYDFVLSTGELDGPYTVDGEVLVDQAEVTLEQETTTPEEEEEVETTTTEEEEEVVETTTEEEVVETTTEGEEVVETTTEEEEEVVETTTEEEVVETTTEEEEEEVVETTTEKEEEVVETTTEEAEEVEPAEEQQLVFKIEQMQIDEWSFVIGDEETADRTETISDVNVQDERVEVNLTELLQEQQSAQGQMTTVSPEEAQEQLEENLSQDLETVRIVIQNVNVENVTLVITAPEGMELPEPPMTTTTEEEEEVETTTEEEEVVETTTEEEEEVETTTEEEVVETTTEEEEDVMETTTEEEEEVVETTTEEDEEAVETTTEEEEEEVDTTTEEEVVETTTSEEDVEEAELDSFEVSGLDAPESATTGDTITVTASVSNPNDQEATQEVAFRLEGTVIDRQSVTLDAGEQTTVTFEVDTEGVPAGQYIHGVYTRDFGDLAVIVLEEPTEETETPSDDGTTVETETPAGDETTTAVTTEA